MNRPRERILAMIMCALWASGWSGHARAEIGGRVADLNNQGLPGAMVTLTKSPRARGPSAMTVFSDEHGAFVFPPNAPDGTLSVRLLGYKQVDGPRPVATAEHATFLMRPE